MRPGRTRRLDTASRAVVVHGRKVNYFAYDTFNRANGSLGYTETVDPDGKPIAAREWTGDTFAISSNKAVNTPSEGADVIVNGGFDADTDWTKGSGWSIGGGLASKAPGSATVISQTVEPLTPHGWWRHSITVAAVAATVIPTFGGAQGSAMGTGSYTEEQRCGSGSGFGYQSTTTFEGTVDNSIVKPLTLAELIASVDSGKANARIQANITALARHPVGVIARVDNTVTPGNFLVAYLSSVAGVINTCVLLKCVGGLYTLLISASITYSAGAPLGIICNGSNVELYYNNLKVGSTQTVSDAGILSNTRHGMFSASAQCSVDNFAVMRV